MNIKKFKFYQRDFSSKGYIKNKFEDAQNENVKVQYVRVPVDDSCLEDIRAHFENAHVFINEALKDPNSRILVHCFAGVSRSATIIISFLMRFKSMSYHEALRFVKQRRDVVQPNEGFVEQLKLYEQELMK